MILRAEEKQDIISVGFGLLDFIKSIIAPSISARGMASKMDLCDTCQNFDLRVFNPTQYPVRGYRAASAFSAAESGCSFCSMLVEACFPEGRKHGLFAKIEHWWQWIRIQAEEDYGDTWRFHHDEEVALGPSQPLALTRLWVAQGLRRKKKHTPIGLLADPDSPAALSGDVMGRLVTGTTSSDDHMRILRQWLQDCRANHRECRLTLSGSQVLNVENASLPTRCVEVTRGSGGARSVRLVETAQKRGKYITLTHRWTSDTTETSTTRLNYGERLIGGSLEGLPRLFENVFDLAEMLSVTLIWIDSICIIQDSAEDWQNEASKMAEYYQSSFFAVTGFENTTDMGLFTAPERSIPKLARLPYRDRDGALRGYFYIHAIDDDDAKAQYTQDIGNSELLTRGWVFQEWILSRRTVSFTKAGCFYQCQKLKPRSPAGGNVYLSEREGGSDNLIFKSRLRLDDLSTPTLVFQRWRLTVHIYSSLALTKAGEDRLIALAGVAKEFFTALDRVSLSDSNTDSQYLSGLWRGDLCKGLLWEVNGINIHPRLPCIPTWTWASIMCSVAWARASQSRAEPSVCLLGIKQTSADEQKRVIDNPGGSGTWEALQISDLLGTKFNTLILSGKLLGLRIGGGFGPGPDLELATSLSDHEIDPEHTRGEGDSPNNPSKRARANWRRVSVTVAPEELCGWASIEDPIANSTTVPMDVLALPVLITPVKGYAFGLGYWKRSHEACSVLFLQRVADGSACFQRIGIGRVFGPTAEKELQRAKEARFWLI